MRLPGPFRLRAMPIRAAAPRNPHALSAEDFEARLSAWARSRVRRSASAGVAPWGMGARSRMEMGGMVLLSKAVGTSPRPLEDRTAEHHEISRSERVCKPIQSRSAHARLGQFGAGPAALKRSG